MTPQQERLQEVLTSHTTPNSSNYGTSAPAFNVCPVCHGRGVEEYQKEVDGQLLEFARKCTRCGGVTEAARNERAIRSGIPNTFNHNLTLKDFDFDIYNSVTGRSDYNLTKTREAIESFINRFNEWALAGKGLYIMSACKGSGKTYLTMCICNELINRYATNVRFVRCCDLLSVARDDAIINGMESAGLLVLDDIGQKQAGASWFSDVLFQIIDKRYQERRPTIYTSNLEPEELTIDERTCDRINDSVIELHLPEVCVRARKAPERATDFLKKMGLM